MARDIYGYLPPLIGPAFLTSDGVALTPRPTLELVGAYDDPDNNRTVVPATSVRASVAVAAYEIDWSLGDVFYKTLGAGAQVFTFANATDGQIIVVEVTGAGSTLTWPTVLWPSGTVPTQTASGTDIYTFVKRGSNIFGSVVQDMS